MERYFYLLALLVSLAGLLTLDLRFKLAFFADWRKAAISIGIGVAYFLIWDAFGVASGVFFRGESAFLTGLQVAPEIPIEEPMFLVVLCLTTLEVFVAVSRWTLRLRTVSGRRRRKELGED